MPSSSRLTNTIFSIVRMRLRVIMLRATARMVSDVRPKWVAVSPISTRSPCRAEASKLISEMNFVTTR